MAVTFCEGVIMLIHKIATVFFFLIVIFPGQTYSAASPPPVNFGSCLHYDPNDENKNSYMICCYIALEGQVFTNALVGRALAAEYVSKWYPTKNANQCIQVQPGPPYGYRYYNSTACGVSTNVAHPIDWKIGRYLNCEGEVSITRTHPVMHPKSGPI